MKAGVVKQDRVRVNCDTERLSRGLEEWDLTTIKAGNEDVFTDKTVC